MGMKKKGRQPPILKIADSSVVHLNFLAYTIIHRPWLGNNFILCITKLDGFDYVCARKKTLILIMHFMLLINAVARQIYFDNCFIFF